MHVVLSSIFRHDFSAHYERVVFHEMKYAGMCRLTQQCIPRVWHSHQNSAAIDHVEERSSICTWLSDGGWH
jgi:hypothetical protein